MDCVNCGEVSKPGTERELGGVSPAASGELSIDELSSMIDEVRLVIQITIS
jgi:hypothetical protein